MKYAAILCFACIPLLWSRRRTARLKGRAAVLSEICAMLAGFQMRLEFDNPTTAELIEGACKDNALPRLKFLRECLAILRSEAGVFSEVWESAALRDKPLTACLTKEDTGALLAFGAALGTTDTGGQLLLCRRFMAEFGEKRAAAEEESARLTKIYTSLGITGALAVVILLI